MKTISIPAGHNPLTVIINGKSYTYRAGWEYTVPDAVAAVLANAAALAPQERASGGGEGGADAGATVVSFTLGEDGVSTDADYAEIFAAAKAGKNVIAELFLGEDPTLGEMFAHGPLANIQGNKMIFPVEIFYDTGEQFGIERMALVWAEDGKVWLKTVGGTVKYLHFAVGEEGGATTVTTEENFDEALEAAEDGAMLIAVYNAGEGAGYLPMALYTDEKIVFAGYAGRNNSAPILFAINWTAEGAEGNMLQ